MSQKLNTSLLAGLAALTCASAQATENYDLRYAPGNGGSDMTAPFEAGWAFQAPLYVYSGSARTSTNTVTDLTKAPFGVPIPGANAVTTTDIHTQFNVTALLPRLSYMSSKQFLGATIGGTVLFPIVEKRVHPQISGVSTAVNAPGLPAANGQVIAGAINAAATGEADQLAAANGNTAYGLGDIEVAPILRWATDSSQVLFIPSVVLPTGDYKPSRAANQGEGKFFTFRPAVQYSYIGDGWDFGSRVAFSVNTRNTDTHYRSGNYFNLDASLMKSLSDAWRAGVAMYGVVQTTRDTSSQAPTDPALAAREAQTLGDKGHIWGAGPQLAYIHGAGQYLLDARVLKEFDDQSRPKGYSAWVTLSTAF